jgi:NAD(P)-dependent dehydrogenase (short-subunit alcohol dehydrogenase family)
LVTPLLQDKIAVVTGGGRGLGRALVEALAHAGADVAFSFRESADGAAETADAVRAAGRRIFYRRADAMERGAVAAFVDRAAAEMGGVDVLVNNVGVFRRVPLEELTEDVLDEAFAVNVKAALMASRAAAPHLALARRKGAIVNVASLGGLTPWPNHIAYGATKAALVMATRSLALALAPDVRVNAVAPGILEAPGAAETVRAKVPLGRFGRLEEAVEAVLFLAAGASYTTGEVLRVDGGRGFN